MLPQVPPVEAWVDSEAKRYHLRVALPGIDPNDVKLNLQGNTLTLSAEGKESRETNEGPAEGQRCRCVSTGLF